MVTFLLFRLALWHFWQLNKLFCSKTIRCIIAHACFQNSAVFEKTFFCKSSLRRSNGYFWNTQKVHQTNRLNSNETSKKLQRFWLKIESKILKLSLITVLLAFLATYRDRCQTLTRVLNSLNRRFYNRKWLWFSWTH